MANYALKWQGRSLEEVDVLFEAKLRAWQFKKFETQGALHVLPNNKEVETMTSPRKASEIENAVDLK